MFRIVVHRDWGGAPEPLCPSPGGIHGAGTRGGSNLSPVRAPRAAAPAGSPGSAPGLRRGAAPNVGCLCYPSFSFPSLPGRASPQRCLTLQGLDVLGGSLGTDMGPAGTGFWDFLLVSQGFSLFAVLLEDLTRFKPRCSFSL